MIQTYFIWGKIFTRFLTLKIISCQIIVSDHWFNSNKLSLNADKSKFILLNKVSQRQNIPLVLPKSRQSNTLTIWVDHITFWRALSYENLTWKNQIKLIQNKISKGLDILHRVKFLLHQKSRKKVYVSFIGSYINYGNNAWSSL